MSWGEDLVAKKLADVQSLMLRENFNFIPTLFLFFWACLDGASLMLHNSLPVYFQPCTPMMCCNTRDDLLNWRLFKGCYLLQCSFFAVSFSSCVRLPPAVSSLLSCRLCSCVVGVCWWGCRGGKTPLSPVWRRCWWTMETGIICSWISA